MNAAVTDSSHLDLERRSRDPGSGGRERLLEAPGDLEKVQHAEQMRRRPNPRCGEEHIVCLSCVS